MTWNEELQAYTYCCPCGDLFQITLVGSGSAWVSVRCLPQQACILLPVLCPGPLSCLASYSLLIRIMQEELRMGEEIARCPSCSLYIQVIYDPVSRGACPACPCMCITPVKVTSHVILGYSYTLVKRGLALPSLRQ